MLIVITFNLLLKITQSQVKEDYRGLKKPYHRQTPGGEGTAPRLPASPCSPHPLPGPLFPLAALGAARTRGSVCGEGGGGGRGAHPTGRLPHVGAGVCMCEGEAVPTHVGTHVSTRARRQGCLRENTAPWKPAHVVGVRPPPAPPSSGRTSRNAASWDRHVVLGTRLVSPVNRPLPRSCLHQASHVMREAGLAPLP